MNSTKNHNQQDFTALDVMAANENPAAIIEHAPLKSSQTYFRSKTFNSQFGLNQLIAAANALLACNLHLRQIKNITDFDQLEFDLSHEIQCFETNAKEKGYSNDTIVIARFLLCATLDDSISSSQISNKLDWESHKLITVFQSEKISDGKFFLVLEKLMGSPTTHIDLLELIYFCLSSGFEGKYKFEADGYRQIQSIKDALYQQIRLIRQEPPALPILQIQQQELPSTKNQVTHPPKPSSIKSTIFKTIVVSVIGMAILYGGFSFMYSKISTPIQHQISDIIN